MGIFSFLISPTCVSQFLITLILSHPLEHFLCWLRKECKFTPQTFMIDCSDVEALGINKAFSDAHMNILYCYWHLWQAWEKNIMTKVYLFIHF